LFERIVTIQCLAALDLGAGVEQPFGCLIIPNRQAVESMGRSIDWTLGATWLTVLFFCAALQRRPCPICTSRSGNVQHRCGGG